jgi:hypothetical protein
MDGKMAKADRFADGLTPEERELIRYFQAHFKVDCNRGRVFSRANRSSRTVGNDNSCWVCVKGVLAVVGAAWQSEWCSVGALDVNSSTTRTKVPY